MTPLLMSTLILPRASFPRATFNNLIIHHSLSSSPSPSPSPPAPTNPTISEAVSILLHHRSRRRWFNLRSLFPTGFTSGEVSDILLHLRRNPRLAQSFFHFATSHSPPLNLHSYATLIHILGRAHLLSRAQNLLKRAFWASSQMGFAQSCDLGNIPLIFRVLVDTYRVCDSSPVVFDLLVKTLLEVNKFDSCVDVVRLLRSRGFSPRVKTCNSLIYNACRVKGCVFGYDLYRELFGYNVDCCDEKNVKRGGGFKVLPNVHTFNELMIAFRRDGLIDMVEEVWIEMSRLNCTPKVCSYSILIGVYCENGEIEKGRVVWEEMKSKGLKPDLVAYDTLIGGYCRVGEIEKAEELYREMGLNGLKGTFVTYQHLMNGYCLVGDVDSALLLYKDMERKGFVPDSPSVDSMVRLLSDKKSALENFEFFQSVMRNAGFVARETSYELLIKGLCSEGKMEEAMKLQAQMVGKGFRPNSHVYGAFIDAYMKEGKFDMVERLKKEMMDAQGCGDG